MGYITYFCIHLFTGDLEISTKKQIYNFMHPDLSDTRRAKSRRGDDRLSLSPSNAPKNKPVVSHKSYISQFFYALAKAMDQVDENDLVNMGAVAEIKTADEDEDGEFPGSEL